MSDFDMFDAIKYLKPSARFGIRNDDYNSLDWYEDYPPPTLEEVQAVLDKFNGYNYIKKRVNEYPTITEQLDILYHEGYDGWREKIEAIKNKYPKP